MNPSELLNHPANRQVLAFLSPLSAHSDIASALTDAVKPLGEVGLYCPDRAAYRYYAACTHQVIFAFACGQSTLAFRLDAALQARALATGGTRLVEAGPEWVQFTLFRSDWPRVDTEFWARRGYEWARKSLA